MIDLALRSAVCGTADSDRLAAVDARAQRSGLRVAGLRQRLTGAPQSVPVDDDTLMTQKTSYKLSVVPFCSRLYSADSSADVR